MSVRQNKKTGKWEVRLTHYDGTRHRHGSYDTKALAQLKETVVEQELLQERLDAEAENYMHGVMTEYILPRQRAEWHNPFPGLLKLIAGWRKK